MTCEVTARACARPCKTRRAPLVIAARATRSHGDAVRSSRESMDFPGPRELLCFANSCSVRQLTCSTCTLRQIVDQHVVDID